MGVDPACNVCGGVAQMLANSIQIFTSQYKERGMGMTQAMNSNFAYLRVPVDKAAELGVQQRPVIKMPGG